jgi:hypothetical protein
MPPLIAAALVEAGVSATVAAVAGDVIFSAALVGLSLLFAPKVPDPDKTKIPIRQSIPPRLGIMGTARSAGAYMLYSAKPSGDQSVDVLAMCDGESNSFERLYLHNDVVILQGDNTVDGLNDGRYSNHKIALYFRHGASPETYFPQASAVVPGLWTVDHRGDGITSVAMLCGDAGGDSQAKVFPNGLPIFSAAINSRRVFDPRDTSQDWADPSTWKFANNDNPILQAVTFAVTSISRGGLGLDFEECFLPVVDEVGGQADICDEDIPLKAGGTHKRYRGGGLWSYDDPPGDTLAAILGACDGFMCERGDGAFTIRAGQFDEDDCDITFTDKHIVSLHVRRFKPDEDDITGVIVKYNSPPHEYSVIDAPVWPRDAYPDSGNDRRVRSASIIWCQHGIQAQRLSKRIAVYEMAQVTATMVVTMLGVAVLDRRFARIQCSDDPALADAVIKLDAVRYDLAKGLHEIDFRVIDPTVLDAWDPATEEGPLQPVVTEPIGDGPVAPSGVVAVAELIASNTRIILVFDDPNLDTSNESYNVHYRIHDVGDGTPGGWSAELGYSGSAVEKIGDTIRLTVNSVAPADLDFEVRNGKHGTSDWSTPPSEVDATAPAPGRPTSFTGGLVGSDVHLAWTAPNSANMDHARVYRGLTGSSFALASDVSGAVAGAALATMSFIDGTPPSATYDYWVVAQSAAGMTSTFAGPQTVTVP